MQPSDVLEFWMGPESERANPDYRKVFGLWFSRGADDEIRSRFSELLKLAEDESILSWCTSPSNCVAALVVLDQFNRNLNRGSAGYFQYDALAQRIAWEYLLNKPEWFEMLKPIERFSVALVLEHSEKITDQDKSIQILEDIVANAATPECAGMFSHALGSGKTHRDEIKRFGRFPHRNVLLGRESTAEEIDYLKNSEQEHHKQASA